jgi:lipoyl(octanoyl) transferase
MQWTLLTDAVGHPGWWQMALDQALLDEAARTGHGWVRFYRWQPATLSLGRNEPALRRYDRARIEARGIDTVRRPTGGRAVWHAREFTYAVAAPLAALGGLAESYHGIHAAIASAVRTFGAPAELAPASRPAELGAGACFTTSVGGEVLSRGRKLVGSAQLRQADAFLQQGSLLLEDDQRLVAELSLAESPPGNEITLTEAARRPVTFAEVAAALGTELAGWGGAWTHGNPALDAEALVARQAARFQDPAWTWRR